MIPIQPVPMADLSQEEIVDGILDAVGSNRRFIAVNAHTLFLIEKDEEFRRIVSASDRFCDGFGVHLIALLQGSGRLAHRNTPTDFMWKVFERFAEAKKTIFVLGDEPGVAEAFAALVNERHGGVIVGAHHGFFEPASEAEQVVLDAIAAAKPDLLCVGMGQPRQEKWAWRLRDRLSCPTFHIGASMAFAIGARRRGPQWATDHGLEWFFRLLAEPAGMFERYLVEIPFLAVHAVRHRTRASASRSHD